eukprot:gene34896-42257_t
MVSLSHLLLATALLLLLSISYGVEERTLVFLATSTASSGYFPYIKAALTSIIHHHSDSLYPVLLISGNASAIPTWMHRLNDTGHIMLLPRQLSFVDRVAQYNPRDARHPAFMRLDIPFVMPILRNMDRLRSKSVQFDYVIHVDDDVLFMPQFRIQNLSKPRVLSMGPELVKQKIDNSGVMYWNISAMTELYP